MSHTRQELNRGAAYCASPDRDPRAPTVPMGPLSCDSHAHIRGPESDFAHAADRIYTPRPVVPRGSIRVAHCGVYDTHPAGQRSAGPEMAFCFISTRYGDNNTIIQA